MLGAEIHLGQGATDLLPEGIDVLITSPGWSPEAPLLAQAKQRGSRSGERWSWPGAFVIPTTLPLAGHHRHQWQDHDSANARTDPAERRIACGGMWQCRAAHRGGRDGPRAMDVLAVELSSFQLHYTDSMRAESAVVLNIAEDHLDWYDDMGAYIADKGRIYKGIERACVYNVSDPLTEQLVREADVVEGARAIGFTLGTPSVGMVGLVENVLADRAFIEERQTTAAEICTLEELASQAPHFVANALAAAALALSHGVPHAAVKHALTRFQPDGHRIELVARVGEVDFVDDSKATNPHAATASLNAYESVVWIAGGLAKGARFDDLVLSVRDRLRGVVLIGRDANVIQEALARHAPDMQVMMVLAGDTEDTEDSEVMDTVVRVAAEMAQPGDTVLLAPGCLDGHVHELLSSWGCIRAGWHRWRQTETDVIEPKWRLQ
ncbi:MAG: UDP-N-acetylmuramoyl-L-alanine--D-glutamate ligase [Marmoricola sp.]